MVYSFYLSADRFVFVCKKRGDKNLNCQFQAGRQIIGGAVNESKSSAQMQRMQAEKLQYDKEQEEHS